jgi:ATP-dependent DNA helicase RecG
VSGCKAMAETHDGFEIARRDLEIRGPGEFLGARQSGARCCALPTWTTTELLVWARMPRRVLLDRHPALARHMWRAGWVENRSISRPDRPIRSRIGQ